MLKLVDWMGEEDTMTSGYWSV